MQSFIHCSLADAEFLSLMFSSMFSSCPNSPRQVTGADAALLIFVCISSVYGFKPNCIPGTEKVPQQKAKKPYILFSWRFMFANSFFYFCNNFLYPTHSFPCLFCTCALSFLSSSPQASLLPALFSSTNYLWSFSLPPPALWQVSPSTSKAPAASQTRSHMHPAQPPSRCRTCYSPLSPENKLTKEVSQTTQHLHDL